MPFPRPQVETWIRQFSANLSSIRRFGSRPPVRLTSK